MIQEVNTQNVKDISKPNQPFDIIGKLIPTYLEGVWSFTESLFESAYEKEYPIDEEEWEDYINNPDKTIFLFYDDKECVGKIRIRSNWNQYALIEDIAVSKSHRKKGVGTQLMKQAVAWSKAKELHGLMLETQDNNLSACRFYHKLGFKIGAVDTMLYANFENNDDEKAIFWYMKF